ncbi:MAG TPA: signal recognition particle-docking protein FtsY [Planctomycetota bacterium]|nr:signal recognition particle-docking protein FtsY [Planctomycetota bacterium]
MGLFGGFIEKFKQGLRKTKEVFTAPLKKIFSVFRNLDEATLQEIEEALITADFGVDATGKIMDALRLAYKKREIETTDKVRDFLKADLKKRLTEKGNDVLWAPKPPTVILVCGVNGVGKTTSIAKISRFFTSQGKKVMLCASDTFRAAAVDQLTIWAERLGVDIVKHKMGSDPAAVVYDAADAAVARGIDILLIDTAGRLQTKENLMKELTKIRNVAAKKIPGAPHEVLLVLDATTGQNAISQAEHFKAATSVTGLFLSKLDGTAKGGIVVAIKDKLDIPVKFVGTGETPDDVARFNADEFVEALFTD